MAVDPRAPHRTALLRLAGNTPHGQPGGLSAQPNRSLRSSNTPAPARNPPAKPRPPASRTEGDRPQGCAVDFTRCAARPRSVTKPELPRRPPTPGPARLIVHHDRPSPPPATASAVETSRHGWSRARRLSPATGRRPRRRIISRPLYVSSNAWLHDLAASRFVASPRARAHGLSTASVSIAV